MTKPQSIAEQNNAMANYVAAVQRCMTARKAGKLHPGDFETIRKAKAYGIGPDDCACQIICNHEEGA
jgi:hypothetical protein